MRIRTLGLILAGLIVSVAADDSARADALCVGVSAVDITPGYPIRLSGFGFRRSESEGVTQHIWAKGLAFREGDDARTTAVIVTVDSLGVPGTLRDEVAKRLAQKAGLDPNRFAVTSSHCHTTPMVSGVLRTLFGRPITPDEQAHINRYTKELTDNIEKAALNALADCKPGTIEFGIGSADLAMNRRTKGGPVDHDLPVLAVRDAQGKLRAIYVSYACHCVTLSNNKVSGDWAGFLQEALQKEYPGAIALTSIGCGADSNPSSGVTGDKVDVADAQGKSLAAEVTRLLNAHALTKIEGNISTKAAQVELMFDTIPTREQYQKIADAGQEYVSYHAKAQIERLDRGEKLQTKLPYLIQTWTFGGNDLAMVFLPGEVVVDYSLRLKKEFDHSRLWINAYSNDVPCYIPSERILKEGGYEGGGAMTFYDRPTRLAEGVEKTIIEEVHRQMPRDFLAPQGTEGIAPKSPEQSLKTIHTEPGLEVELVASEPLVSSPVAIDWGADGKLWVCEMYDYPTGVDQNWQPGGRVKFLEDLDFDGKYDEATVFLKGLPFPTGVTAWGKGILVCAAPDIIYAEDTNGDGVADKVEKLFSGFVTDNYQARVNSLSLGLDNWIYGANGLLGGTITDAAKKQSVDIRNHDFRFQPLNGKFETVAGLTQQGRARDDWGHWFGCDNGSGMIYYPREERYLARNPHMPAPPPLTRPPGVDYDAGRVYPISRQLERFNNPDAVNQFTAGCGLGVYRDTLLGEAFYGNVFTCEPVNNLVARAIPVEDANGMIVARKRGDSEKNADFLASTDNWFRPVQARPGPDGALYIVDMYRFLIEHPRWIQAERLAKIDARAGSDRGRIYRIKPAGKTLRRTHNLTKLSAQDVAAEIDSPNGIERDRVQVQLLSHPDKSAQAVLSNIARNASLPQVRAQAASAFAGIAGADLDSLGGLLKDADPRVRREMIRLFEPLLRDNRNPPAVAAIGEVIAGLADDSSSIVRLQAAYTLGEWNDPRAGAELAHLATSRLSDAEMRLAVLSSSGGTHCGDVLAAVMALPKDTPGRAAWIPPLIATAAASNDDALFAKALAAVLPDEASSPTAADFESVAAMMESLDRRKGQLPADVSPRLEKLRAAARTVASDAKSPAPTRVSALKLLGHGETSADEFDLLCRLAASGDESIREASIAALRRHTSPAVSELLLKSWRQTSPSARPALINLLLSRDAWTLALLDGVKRNIVGRSEISLAEQQHLTKGEVAAEIRKLAVEVFPATATDASRQAVIDQYAGIAKIKGEASKGAEVFAQQCATCHLLNGVGHAIGPDLSILRERDADYFVKNVLDPSAIVEPRFTYYQVVLKDRRVIAGLINSENSASLSLVAGGGATETVARADVKDIRASRVSMMPEGLESAIPPQQMADLIAFLKSTGSRKTFPNNSPATIAPAGNGVLMLSAATAEIYGDPIAFEQEFHNIGFWSGAGDSVAWSIRIDKAADYDVYLDYACADISAGASYVISAGRTPLTGAVAGTGSDWSNYKQVKVGTLHLDAGQQRLVIRPEGDIRQALMDLRTIALTPQGVKPKWLTTASSAQSDQVARDPVSVAKIILDPTVSTEAREAAVNANPQFAAELIAEMTRNLEPGKIEHERIPWIWRVAIAAGKRNDTNEVKAILDASLPKIDETLRDWQAVVVGGGVINGLSERGHWPAVRIAEIIGEDQALLARWNRSLTLGGAMADDEKVQTGTRYDALRMLGVLPWAKSGEHLRKFLAKDTHAELQQGAVSALADIDAPEAAVALREAMPNLTPKNQELAKKALEHPKGAR